MAAEPVHNQTRENANEVGKLRIRIAAAIIRNDAGENLLVRKRGTRAFMQAGGKIKPGEDAAQALRREVAEELGATIATAEFVGSYSAPAANEDNHIVCADVFRAELASAPVVCAEIEELLWVGRNGLQRDDIAPLSRMLLEQHPTS